MQLSEHNKMSHRSRSLNLGVFLQFDGDCFGVATKDY